MKLGKIDKKRIESGVVLGFGNYEILKDSVGIYWIFNHKLKIRLQFASYRMARHTLGQLLNG